MMKNSSLIMLLCLVFTGQAQVNLSSSLTACYTLDGVVTEPVSNLQGTVAAAVTPTLNRFGLASSAMKFGGQAGQVIRLPNSPLLKPAKTISISGWFRMPSLEWMIAVFAKNTSTSYFTAYSITMQNMGANYFFRCYRQNGIGDNVLTSTTPILANTWYHLVFCISETNMQLYVNGVLEASMQNTIANFNFDPTREVILGGTNEGNFDRPYSGIIDNLRFYNRIINAAEALALFQSDPVCLKEEVTTALREEAAESNLVLQPNPFTDRIVIDGVGDLSEVSLLDVCGRLQPCDWQGHQVLIPELPAGIYFLKIRVKEKCLIRKVIRL